jgi:hypothetical protein
MACRIFIQWILAAFANTLNNRPSRILDYQTP